MYYTYFTFIYYYSTIIGMKHEVLKNCVTTTVIFFFFLVDFIFYSNEY